MAIKEDKTWLEWLTGVMSRRPASPNHYLDSERGVEVTRLVFAFERDNYSWRRGDEDTFWIDIQLFVKYGLSDEQILFVCKTQPGVENYKKHKPERDAYAEMMRGIEKLRRINGR